jgi:hypothetical protein
MNQDWQNFLMQQGAQLLERKVQHFGNLQSELIASREDTVLCDLSQFGTIKVSGEEAQKFLQSLLSNDISLVTSRAAQLSSFNSPKGRMLASFLIWQQGGEYFLQLPHSLTAAMHKKLSMYVLRAKVKISDVSDEIVCVGIAGNKAENLIKQQLGALPEQDWMVTQNTYTQNNDVNVIRLSQNRYMLSTTSASAIALWTKFSAETKPVGSACWDWLNIRAGIPVITPATQEQFVLQMTNLDLLGGVSFTKGCYPGQEIVARTHYLGKQKRRMFLAHIESAVTPSAGDEVFGSEPPTQACGMVINATAAPDGGFDLLVVMQISSHETGNVHLHSAEGAKLDFLTLPYTFPTTE